MKSLTRYIPNTLTCISLAFGFYAAILGLAGDYFGAMIAIFIAALFDFSDGLAARLLNAYSDMGKELDSLADMVSFGVAPGMMLFSLLDKLLHLLAWNESWPCKLFLLSAFAIPIFSGLRLAKFNIDNRQSSSFLGFPVPAHAILWSSLITALAPSLLKGGIPPMATDTATLSSAFQNIHFQGLIPVTCLEVFTPEIVLFILPILAILTSLLLVSEIPMFSLKISSFAWRTNKLQYILIISALLFVPLFGVFGIFATIVLYLFLSMAFYRP